MAAGGVDTKRDSVKGSDEFNPFECNPCSRKGRDIGAEVYCVQCGKYLCNICVGDHNKFAKMAAHKLLDKMQMEAMGPQQQENPILTVPCDLHPSHVNTVYCGKHDQVCCGICVLTEHKSCDVVYIPKVAKGITDSTELNEFNRAMEKLRKDLENMKIQRENDIQRLSEDKDVAMKNIRITVEQMAKELEQLEKAAMTEIKIKFDDLIAQINDDVKQLDARLEQLKKKLNLLEKANEESEIFVYMKSCKQNESNIAYLIRGAKARSGKETLKYQLDNRAKDSLRTLQSLGALVHDYCYTVTPFGQHISNTQEDEELCSFLGICIADDDTLIIADSQNTCLKRLDMHYNILDRLTLTGQPCNVCFVLAGLVAVTLTYDEKVQLISLGDAMSVLRSFKVAGSCRGVAYHDNHLYIACGDSQNVCPSFIGVYSLSGMFLRAFETDALGELFLSVPLDVAVSRASGLIIVCDRDSGLVALGLDGQRVWNISCHDLGIDNVNRVCVDRFGQLLVSSRKSNKVVLVSGDGRKLSDVLTAKHDIQNPVSVCYDKQRWRIVVGMLKNNHISVFSLT